MKLKIILFLFSFLKFSNLIFSQDIQLTQINTNALIQNPANSGDFKEDFRFIAGIRNQWKSVTKPFSTETVSFDFKLKHITNFSFGSIFINDVTGDGVFRTNELRILPSYIYYLTKKSKFHFGIDLGLNYRQLNFNNFKFGNQFDGLQFNESIPSEEMYKNQSKLNATLGIGTTYTLQTSRNTKYMFGVSLYNLNQPNQSFYNNPLKRDVRIHLSTLVSQPLTKKIAMSYSINMDFQGVYKAILLGSQLNYTFNYLTINPVLSAGLYHRFKDAVIILLGLHYSSYYLGFTYDINVSQLSKASNGKGASELCFVYTFHRKNSISHFPIKCYDYF